ncbi:MAG: RNA polymerase subunit sigma-24, partial [Acidobacteriaceae bacterium]|nr:RNA polymerase subunit sigma-24 [Acidobacteriaceae bacterium]
LNREQREVIELTHFEGMSQTEIAQKLQKPLGTVKSLVRSALKSLRTAMVGAGIP